MDECDLVKQFNSQLIEILNVLDSLLVHPHAWVRESSSQLLLNVLSGKNDSLLTELLPNYWLDDRAKSLALKVVCQLKCKFVEMDHMDSCKKLILFFLNLFLERLKKFEGETKPELLWLVQKLNGVAADENSNR